MLVAPGTETGRVEGIWGGEEGRGLAAFYDKRRSIWNTTQQ